ncbi:MAG TPA: LamG domain-containing protein, partial [Clostridia bacterium]|nr:LamG domain-containing protein [Clostridia bacterium]
FYPATDGVLWLFGNKALGQFELSLYPTSGSSGYLSFMIGFNSPTVSTATVQWSPDEWYHLVVRRANNVITIYRNLSMLAQKETTYGNNADPLSRQLIFGNRYINGSFTHSRFQGQLDDIRIYNRALSWPELQELQEYGSGLRVVLVRALKPSFYNLSVGTSYQLQVADGLGNWINQGSPFTATNSMMIYPQYWDVDKWQQLYFRLQVVPQPNN